LNKNPIITQSVLLHDRIVFAGGFACVGKPNLPRTVPAQQGTTGMPLKM
jgi:hypothetical protein